MAEPSTWRVEDGSAVEWAVATAAWADAAVPVLRHAGATYGRILRYGDLGTAVQDHTGIRTKSLLQNWIGDVLRAVTNMPAAEGEPMLSSLVVRANGTVGPGYAGAVLSRYGEVPEDPEVHAAVERLDCYRYLGADVPAAAVPTLPPDLAARRQKVAAKRKAAQPRPKCPSCGRWKASGVALCDDCGDR